MANVTSLERSALADLEPQLQMVEAAMGFLPRSLLTMGRRPSLLRSFVALAATIQREADLDPELVQLVAHVASTAAGCRYCQAHTAVNASRRGGIDGRVPAVWEFETSDLFTESERAALRLARDAATAPGSTTEKHFDELRRFFSEEQIVDLVAVISLFGFLNRWNDTMATELEEEPLRFAEENLSERGWAVGKHASGV